MVRAGTEWTVVTPVCAIGASVWARQALCGLLQPLHGLFHPLRGLDRRYVDCRILHVGSFRRHVGCFSLYGSSNSRCVSYCSCYLSCAAIVLYIAPSVRDDQSLCGTLQPLYGLLH